MAIEYKNAVKTISTTGSDQLVYTVPTTTNQQQFTGIVKTFTILNTTGGAGTANTGGGGGGNGGPAGSGAGGAGGSGIVVIRYKFQ